MRADRQVQNQRQAEQTAVDLEAAQEHVPAVRIERVRGDAGLLVDPWVQRGPSLRSSRFLRKKAKSLLTPDPQSVSHLRPASSKYAPMSTQNA